MVHPSDRDTSKTVTIAPKEITIMATASVAKTNTSAKIESKEINPTATAVKIEMTLNGSKGKPSSWRISAKVKLLNIPDILNIPDEPKGKDENDRPPPARKSFASGSATRSNPSLSVVIAKPFTGDVDSAEGSDDDLAEKLRPKGTQYVSNAGPAAHPFQIQ